MRASGALTVSEARIASASDAVVYSLLRRQAYNFRSGDAAGCMVVFAVDISRRMMELRGTSF